MACYARYISHDGKKGFVNNKIYLLKIMVYGKNIVIRWQSMGRMSTVTAYSSMRDLLADWDFINV